MKYEKKGWYELSLPEGWSVEEEGDSTDFHPAEGVGILHVSVQRLPVPPAGDRPATAEEFLNSFLWSTGAPFRKEGIRALSPDRACYEGESRGPEGRILERMWMVTTGGMVALCSYSRREGEGAEEAKEVERVVAGLRFVGTSG